MNSFHLLAPCWLKKVSREEQLGQKRKGYDRNLFDFANDYNRDDYLLKRLKVVLLIVNYI